MSTRHRLAVVVLIASLVVGAVARSAGILGNSPAASAQTAPTTTIVPLPDEPAQRPSIIPLPNSGREPERQGDPGSAAQYAVMGGIILGLGLIGVLVARDSKRHAANKTHTPAAKSSD